MKKNSIIFLGVVIVCIALFFSLSSFWEFYNFGKFKQSYRGEDYSGAQKYIDASSESPIDKHNLGNVYYILATASPEEDRALLLQKSLVSYSGSLLQQEHPDTRYNYEYVKELLKTEEITEEDQKQEETEENNDQSENNQQQEEEEGNEGDTQDQHGNGSTIQDTRGEQYKLGEQQQINPLTADEREALKQATEYLKEEQAQNQQFFNKQEQSSDFQKAFDSLLNRGGDKDW